MKSTITESQLRVMEQDADAMKAELHVGTHVRTLAAEVRRLSAGDSSNRPSGDEVATAIRFLEHVVERRNSANVTTGAELLAVETKAVAVLDRYFS